MSTQRVLVAMSGGVDSSVAALRLVEQGLEVVGVTLHLWDYPEDAEPGRCCAPEDQYDARRVCDHLGIPHFTFDRRELFADTVVRPFVADYLAGNTPSPCVSCNRTVKLRELLPLSDRLGASHVATGHYARVVRAEGGAVELHRAVDEHKDQSYFLHMLRQDELARLLLPLGDATKGEVREQAVRAGLPGAAKGESQELCFIASGRYDAFVEERADGRIRPGKIVDTHGRTLGEHGGLHRFTVGQRKGLGVAMGQRAFVVAMNADAAEVRIGTEEELLASGAILDGDVVLSAGVTLPRRAEVKVRARHAPVPAELSWGEAAGTVEVRFDQPVRAVSPGQIAVAYDGTRVIGGGRIRSALVHARPPVGALGEVAP